MIEHLNHADAASKLGELEAAVSAEKSRTAETLGLSDQQLRESSETGADLLTVKDNAQKTAPISWQSTQRQ